nr:unnamed protein product [Spirometra erinaceieuropaei]
MMTLDGVPAIIIAMIKAYYRSTTARVLARNNLSQPFGIRSGVRQGCILSPILFNYAIDCILGRAVRESDGVQFTPGHRLTDLDYADDIASLASSFGDLQSMVSRVNEVPKSVGLSINDWKTKVFSNCISDQEKAPLGIDGCQLEEVDSFKYLGARLLPDGQRTRRSPDLPPQSPKADQQEDLTIETIELLLQSKYDETENRLGHDQILQLLQLCLRTYFAFDGTIYEQVKGTPMGSPISGFIAEAVLQRLESLVFQHPKPKFWARYVDDTFVVIEGDQVLTFKEHLNAVLPDTQLTMEGEENNQLAFLDALVCRKDCGGPKTKVFTKATNTMQVLNFNSNHPISHKRSRVRTLY